MATERIVAGEPLSEEPSDWTPTQIEAMLPQAIEKADAKFIEGLLMLLALKDPRRAQKIVETMEVGFMLRKELDGHA